MEFKHSSGDGNGGKNFLRLKNGESAVGVFRGDILDFKQHWVNGKSQLCTGVGCEICALKTKESKATFRFRVNFITKNPDGTYTPKIFEQGWKVYNQMKGLHEGDYDLEKTIVRVSRSGSNSEDTVYSILPIPQFNVSPQLENTLSGIQLLSLSHEEKVEDSHSDEPPFLSNDLDIPF